MSDLSRWCVAHYQALHDFAAPVATIIAAGAAVVVTWRLGLRQAAIAQQQAETARRQAATSIDRFRLDLFEKRYAIYEAAKKLIVTTMNNSRKPDFGPDNVIPYYLAIDEASFFFPPSSCERLVAIRDACQQLIVESAGPEIIDPNGFAQRQIALINTLRSMPEDFGADLSFGHIERLPF